MIFLQRIMGIFSKTENKVALNAADYTDKLLDSALKEYRKQRKNLDLLSDERNNAALGFYEKQFIGSVVKKTIDAINTAKGVFGEDYKEVNLLCKQIEDDVACISYSVFEKGLDGKLKSLRKMIGDVKKEL